MSTSQIRPLRARIASFGSETRTVSRKDRIVYENSPCEFPGFYFVAAPGFRPGQYGSVWMAEPPHRQGIAGNPTDEGMTPGKAFPGFTSEMEVSGDREGEPPSRYYVQPECYATMEDIGSMSQAKYKMAVVKTR